MPSSAQDQPFEPPSAKASTSNKSFRIQESKYSGSLVYSYDIKVPPGVQGLQPNISLSYNNQSVKEISSWCGLGWDINLSYVQRDVSYDSDKSNMKEK